MLSDSLSYCAQPGKAGWNKIATKQDLKPDEPEQAPKRHNNHPGFPDWEEAAEMLLALVKLWSGEKSISFPGEMPKLQTRFTLWQQGLHIPPPQLTGEAPCTDEERPPPTHWTIIAVI